MTDFLSMTAQQVEGLPENQAQEVLDAWVSAKKPELPQALSRSSSKVHAKLAKKAIYRLQSSGVALPEAAPAAAPVLLEEAPKNEFPAVLSMQLGTGERAFLFGVPLRGGGLEVFQGIVHDEFGLAQFGSERANRNLYRKRMAQLEADPSARVMLVPFERMRLELGRALTLNTRSKTVLGPEIEQTLSRLGVTAEDPDFPIPPLEPGDEASREEGAGLHRLFEVEQWLPSEGDLAKLTTQLDALKVLPLDEAQRAAKSAELACTLSHEVFTPAVRQIYARRLWYTAEVLDAQQRTAEAQQARAEARRLFHETTPSRFAEQLFEKALPTLAARPAASGMPAPK